MCARARLNLMGEHFVESRLPGTGSGISRNLISIAWKSWLVRNNELTSYERDYGLKQLRCILRLVQDRQSLFGVSFVRYEIQFRINITILITIIKMIKIIY